MPCTYDGPSVDNEVYERLNLTTRLACEYLSGLEAAGKPIPEHAVMWWTQHKIEDARRAERAQRTLRELEARKKSDALYQQLLCGGTR